MTFPSIHVVSAGDTYILRKPGDGVPHLWAVLTDPDKDDTVVIVNLTTRQPHSDDTVILHPGDHPFVLHETVVFYQDACLAKTSALTKAVRGGAATMHNAFRPDVPDHDTTRSSEITQYSRSDKEVRLATVNPFHVPVGTHVYNPLCKGLFGTEWRGQAVPYHVDGHERKGLGSDAAVTGPLQELAGRRADQLGDLDLKCAFGVDGRRRNILLALGLDDD